MSTRAFWKRSTFRISKCVATTSLSTNSSGEPLTSCIPAPFWSTSRDGDRALDRLVAALKPGGWLLAEETDSISYVAGPRAGEVACDRFLKVMRAHQAASTGVDLFYGRRLYADLLARGLVDVAAEGRSNMVRGATPSARFWRLTYTQLREPAWHRRSHAPRYGAARPVAQRG